MHFWILKTNLNNRKIVILMNLRLLCVTVTSIKSDIYSELLNNNTISIGTIFLDYFFSNSSGQTDCPQQPLQLTKYLCN